MSFQPNIPLIVAAIAPNMDESKRCSGLSPKNKTIMAAVTDASKCYFYVYS